MRLNKGRRRVVGVASRVALLVCPFVIFGWLHLHVTSSVPLNRERIPVVACPGPCTVPALSLPYPCLIPALSLSQPLLGSIT